MMSIDAQTQLINQLCHIMYESVAGDFESMECCFDYEEEGSSWSVESTFSFIKDNSKHHKLLLDDKNKAPFIVYELHNLMEKHTQGFWYKVIVSIDENREAKTKFIYEVQSCMDEFDD